MKRNGPLLYVSIVIIAAVVFQIYLQLRLELHDPTAAFKFFASRSELTIDDLNKTHNFIVHQFRSHLLSILGSAVLTLCLIWRKAIPWCLESISSSVKSRYIKTLIVIGGLIFLQCSVDSVTDLVTGELYSAMDFTYDLRNELEKKLLLGSFIYAFVAIFGRFTLLTFPLMITPVYFAFYLLLISHISKKFEPMDWSSEHGKVFAAFLEKVGYPKSRFFVGKKGLDDNAFYAGSFGTEKDSIVVVAASFIEKFSPREVLAVVAHELGHWADNIGLKLLFFYVFFAFAVVYVLLVFLSRKKFAEYFFGTEEEGDSEKEVKKKGWLYRLMPEKITPMHVTLTAILFFNQILFYFNVNKNLTLQFAEFRADDDAANHGLHQELSSFLIKQAAMTNASLDPLFESFSLSHPCIERRVKKLLGMKSLNTSA